MLIFVNAVAPSADKQELMTKETNKPHRNPTRIVRPFDRVSIIFAVPALLAMLFVVIYRGSLASQEPRL